MKVVGIVGSPRSGGNTEFLVRKVLNVLESKDVDVELITLCDKNINFCLGCDKCKTSNKCVIEDDMQEITDKIRDADGVVAGSPVYFGSMTGQLKTLFDRLRPLRNIHAFKYKVCGALSCGGFRNGGQETTIQSIHESFLIQGGIVVGDDRPTAHYGCTGVGKTSDDEIGIQTGEYLANRMYDVLKKLNE